ncbi:hypothetical protein [Shimia ponticola]|uniref:hypothetical protein n=1 Tax=Shimia ponticola TaxID=2582893 RepID=UPI0011BF7DE3|nr:hypothetical protein [Shimia ponticola]
MGAQKGQIRHLFAPRDGAEKVLFVGDVTQLLTAHPDLPTGPEAIYASFDDLGAELIDISNPDVVISPLMGPAFDAIELAEQLDILGFEGRYVVIAPQLPRPDIIQRDIMSAAPGVEIELRITRPN